MRLHSVSKVLTYPISSFTMRYHVQISDVDKYCILAFIWVKVEDTIGSRNKQKKTKKAFLISNVSWAVSGLGLSVSVSLLSSLSSTSSLFWPLLESRRQCSQQQQQPSIAVGLAEAELLRTESLLSSLAASSSSTIAMQNQAHKFIYWLAVSEWESVEGKGLLLLCAFPSGSSSVCSFVRSSLSYMITTSRKLGSS